MKQCVFPKAQPAAISRIALARQRSRGPKGANLEDCTKPLKQTSAGAVWSGWGFTCSRSGPGLGWRKQASAGCGLERSDSSDTVSQLPLCVWDSRDSKGESPVVSVFHRKGGKSEYSGPTLPITRCWTAKCGRSACSSSPLGKSAARAESCPGSESVSTRSPRPQKRVRPQQTRPTRLLRPHTSVHLSVSHPLTHSLNQVLCSHAVHSTRQHNTKLPRVRGAARCGCSPGRLLSSTRSCRPYEWVSFVGIIPLEAGLPSPPSSGHTYVLSDAISDLASDCGAGDHVEPFRSRRFPTGCVSSCVGVRRVLFSSVRHAVWPLRPVVNIKRAIASVLITALFYASFRKSLSHDWEDLLVR